MFENRIAASSMTTSSSPIVRIWNCSVSRLTEDGTGGSVVLAVEVVDGLGVGAGSAVEVGELVTLGSDVADGDDGGNDSEGEGVTTHGPIPVIDDPIEEDHISPPRLGA
jgi:hypothetical protein